MKQDAPATDGGRPRTQPEINEYRRRTLMEGAIDSLAEHGVSGTTVRTICAAAGTSRGLIGHYYSSKEDLLAAALRHLFDGAAEDVRKAIEAKGPSAMEQLRAVPAALFSPPVFTERNCTAFLALWHEIRFNDAVRKANQELYRGYLGRIETLIREAARETGADIDAARSARGFVSLSDGLWLGLSIHDKVSSPGQAINICRRYIDRELAA